MKLTIELVPSTSWYTNVRSKVSRPEWDIIRRKCYKEADYKCEICADSGKNQGVNWPVECHEIWKYNDTNHIQTLIGFIALCPNCHKVKHIGLSQIKGWMDIVYTQLTKINNISKDTALKYIDESFEVWKSRSQYEWEVNINYITKILK